MLDAEIVYERETHTILKIKFKRLDPLAKTPEYAHGLEDAAADLFSVGDYVIPTRAIRLINTGLALQIPLGYVGLIQGRSSIEIYGLHIHAGVIDSGYRGEIKVMLSNESYASIKVNHHQKIAQILLVPLVHGNFTEVKFLDESERNTGGFGSTDIQALP